MIGDFRLNIFNSETAAQYANLGIENAVLSPELTLPMARDIGGGEIVYGRIPLMLTERCFIKENFGCKSCNKAALKDRTGAEFPMLREYQHRNIILNSAPTYMADKGSELSAAGISHRHFQFTVETAAEVKAVIRMFESGAKWSAKAPFRRIGKRESTKK
jgi:putative protease